MNEPKHFESLYPDTAREQEISKIVSFVREGNSSQLIGLPGVGRSSVLALLSHNRDIRRKHFPTTQAYIHFVNIDFSEARNRSLLDVYKLLFLNLSDSLRERAMQEEYAVVNEILREALAFQDELVLSQGLKRAVEYLSVEKKLTIIFLFDRFEEYTGSLASEFFTTLRVLRNKAKYRFSVVFSVTKPLEEIVDAGVLSDFYEFFAGHTVYTRLYDPVSIEFRKSYLEKMTGKHLAKDAVTTILTQTGGHWKLARLSLEALLAKPDEMKEVSLQEFLLDQLTIRNGLLEIWRALTPLEQECLEKGEGEEGAVAYLERVGLLHGKKCTIPLLIAFMEESRRIAQTEKEPIIYDEGTKTIKKGELVLSDSLTGAEFRLLRYLLQHPDTVVDREEAIEVVWQGNATTQGVTDQAVDQLIFRLRRKIEDDPNNPEHLQTVKGRGFRFTP